MSCGSSYGKGSGKTKCWPVPRTKDAYTYQKAAGLCGKLQALLIKVELDFASLRSSSTIELVQSVEKKKLGIR